VLSDREHETLYEIQRRLLVEDPSFAQSFDADVQRLPREPRDRHQWAYTVAIVVAVALCVLMVLAQSPGTALAFAAIAGALFMARRWRHGTHQRRT
jgi:Flp pilus assembly protein TadB